MDPVIRQALRDKEKHLHGRQGQKKVAILTMDDGIREVGPFFIDELEEITNA